MAQKIHLLWEQTDESADELSACIRGDAPAFRNAASILLSYVQSMPDAVALRELNREYERRTPIDTTGIMRIASQLGGTLEECYSDADLCSVYESAPGLEQLVTDYIACFGVNPLSAIKYRNKPDDECLVQVSTDNGSTWSDGWRMDNCISSAITNVFNTQNTWQDNFYYYTLPAVNNYNNNYEDSLGDIYPDLMPESEEAGNRNNALCHSLVVLVRNLCDLSIDYYQQRDESQNEINLGLAITAGILAIIGIAGALPTAGASLSALGVSASIWGAAIGVSAAIGNALYDKWQSANIENYQDLEARNAIVCYLYDKLKNTDVTQSDFANAFNEFLGENTNQQVIADTLEQSIALEQTYATFASYWNKAFNDTISIGVVYDDCPCDCDILVTFTNVPPVVEEEPGRWINDTHELLTPLVEAPPGNYYGIEFAGESELPITYLTFNFIITGTGDGLLVKIGSNDYQTVANPGVGLTGFAEVSVINPSDEITIHAGYGGGDGSSYADVEIIIFNISAC